MTCGPRWRPPSDRRSRRSSAGRSSRRSSPRACGSKRVPRTRSRFSRSRPIRPGRPSTTACARRSSTVPRRGLPDSIAMRHDQHYVEALAASAGTPIGRMIAIDQIDPNPNQPRQVMGDLSELIASISEKGIIEPLVVRQRGERFQIVAGERRYQAAVQVGLRELPVVVRDVEQIASQGGTTRQRLREAVAKPKAGRPKHYVFAFRPPTKAFNLKLSFNKSRASREEIIDALEAILRDLRKGK